MKVSLGTLLLTTTLLFEISNANKDESDKCALAPTYGWVAVRCKGGYAIKCNGIGLSDVPTSFPRYENSSRLCLLDFSKNH